MVELGVFPTEKNVHHPRRIATDLRVMNGDRIMLIAILDQGLGSDHLGGVGESRTMRCPPPGRYRTSLKAPRRTVNI